ncbi:MAG: hypothetical protein L3J39_06800 [Verrucomicrobiales bacterium]|nr:hypothetical protein [Verrucomicrobiales bacterium]
MKLTKTKLQKNTAAPRNPPLSVFQCFLLLALTALPACQTAKISNHTAKPTPALTPFVSDGCSCVPDGPPSDPQRWHPACAQHDRAYWSGGTRRQRLTADRQLVAEIKQSGNPLVSEIYYLGIRLGGSPYFHTPWSWGYGRPWPSGYTHPDSI